MKYFKNHLPLTILVFCFSFSMFSQKISNQEIVRLKKLSQQVTIIRDNWGIAHVYGKTDADGGNERQNERFHLAYAVALDNEKQQSINSRQDHAVQQWNVKKEV